MAPPSALSGAVSARIAASVGPVHGAQPRAKAAPSRGAPARPAAGFHRGTAVRCKPIPEPTPRKTSARTITTAPPMRVSRSRCSRSAKDTADATATSTMNTTVKPRTKSRAPRTRFDRRRCSSATSERPVTYPRKPGTSGSTHGDANDTIPAASATTTAIGSAAVATAASAAGRYAGGQEADAHGLRPARPARRRRAPRGCWRWSPRGRGRRSGPAGRGPGCWASRRPCPAARASAGRRSHCR